MPEFIQGRKLSGLLFTEVIQPLLDANYPQLEYSAGLFGYGSEVLGFDTEMSRDHDWGPRVQLFLTAVETSELKHELFDFFALNLPRTFYGYSTHFGKPNEADKGTRHLEFLEEGPISHRIEVTSWQAYLADYLPVDVSIAFKPVDWLIIPQQKLRTITGGSIFHDPNGYLRETAEKLAWYPEQVWLFLLASAWSRIGQEEHLMGRCGYVGDEIGSAILGNSILRTLMQICFFMEKQYAPYPKWFGTAFHQLDCAKSLEPMILAVQCALSWTERQEAMVNVYRIVTRLFNTLRLIEPVSEESTDFFNRPFSVIWGGLIAEKLQTQIVDPVLRSAKLTGNIDLISSSTDVLEYNSVCAKFRHLFDNDNDGD